ncbi:hypothetical protein DIPPA_06571 [Diplonema papillatum]|nr:hypothetical protein DIPPA_06571 [Diplonema papillatum]
MGACQSQPDNKRGLNTPQVTPQTTPQTTPQNKPQATSGVAEGEARETSPLTRAKSTRSAAARSARRRPGSPSGKAEPGSPAYHVRSVPGTGGVLVDDLEAAVFWELNWLRTDPRRYAKKVEKIAGHISRSGTRLVLPGYTDIALKEGRSAYAEAVHFLKKQKPLPAYKGVPRSLHLAARDHARDQRKHGFQGHKGSDGSTLVDRLARRGVANKNCAENISYGMKTAEHIVIQLLVDDGVKDRGHRRNMFKPEYNHVGIACERHPHLHHLCVIDYAEL